MEVMDSKRDQEMAEWVEAVVVQELPVQMDNQRVGSKVVESV
jgi:hypothetical protein